MDRNHHESRRQQTPDPTLSILNRLRLTARVAVSVSLAGTAVLMLTLYRLLGEQSEENYLQVIQSLTRSQDQLLYSMLTAGTLILLLAGLITWFITLYSSHRVAGPLYRFSKNIELEIPRGPVATIGLRRDDGFQDVSRKLSDAADGLAGHYAAQLQVIDELSAELDADEPPGELRYREVLQKLEHRVSAL